MFSKVKHISAKVLAFFVAIAMFLTIVAAGQPALAVDPSNTDPTDPILSADLQIEEMAGVDNLWKATYTITPKKDIIPESSDIIVIMDYGYVMQSDNRIETAKKGLLNLVDEIVAQEGTKNRMAIILQGSEEDSSTIAHMTDDVDALKNAINGISSTPTGQDYQYVLSLARQELEDVVNLDKRATEYNKKKTVLWMSATKSEKEIPANFQDAMIDLTSWKSDIDNKIAPYNKTDVNFELYSLGIGKHVSSVPEAMIDAVNETADLNKYYLKCEKESDFKGLIEQFGKAVLNIIDNANATFNVNAPFYIIDKTDETYGPQPGASATVSTDGTKIDFKDVKIAKPTDEKPSTVLEFYITINYNGGSGTGGGGTGGSGGGTGGGGGTSEGPKLVVDGNFTYDGGTHKPKEEVVTKPVLSTYKVSFESSSASMGTLSYGGANKTSFPDLISIKAMESLTAAQIPTPMPKATLGYEFKGWMNKEDPTKTIIDDLTAQAISGNTTFVAVFQKMQHLLVLDLNGGTFNGSTSSIEGRVEDEELPENVAPFSAWKSGSSYSNPTPVSSDSEFIGWIRDGDSSKKLVTTKDVLNNEIYGPDTYIAQYKTKAATVTYGVKNNTGGTLDGTTTYANVDFGTLVSAAGTIPTPKPAAGYSFSHWEVNGAATQYTDATVGALKVNSNPYSILAVFVKEKKTVTFDVNGGTLASGMNASQTVEYGNKATGVKDPSISDPSKEFDYWEGPAGKHFTSSEIMNEVVTGDVTYKAIYKTRKVNITFVTGNASQGSVQNVGTYTIDYNTTLTGNSKAIPSTTPATGYEFDSWTIGGVKITEADLKTKQFIADTQVVANFKKGNYTVTFDVNGGTLASGMNASQTVVYQDKATGVKDPSISDPSKEFDYWQNDAGQQFSSADINNAAVTSDVNYKAVYKTRKVNITFNTSNASQGSVQNVGTYTIDYNTTLTENSKVLPATTPATGYEFDYWSIGGTKITEADLKTKQFTADTEVLANFKKQNYTVTFDVNGGTLASGMNASQSVIYQDKATGVQDPTSSDSNKQFAGWKNSTTGQTLSSADVMNQAVTADVTYVAQYGAILGTVQYAIDPAYTNDQANLIGTTSFSNIAYGTTIASGTRTPSVDVIDTNYVFSHWAIDGVEVDLATYEVKAPNTTVVAVLKENVFAVTYNPAEGQLPAGHAGTENVVAGNSPTNVPLVVAPAGKAFDYWRTDEGGSFTNDQVKLQVITKKVTYTAVYSDDSNGDGIPDQYQYKYTVNFKAASQTILFDGKPAASYAPIIILGGDSRVNNTNVTLDTVPMISRTDGQNPKLVWTSNPAGTTPASGMILSPSITNEVVSGKEYEITFTIGATFTVTFINTDGLVISNVTVNEGEYVPMADITSAQSKVKTSGRVQKFQHWTCNGRTYSSEQVSQEAINSDITFIAVCGSGTGTTTTR